MNAIEKADQLTHGSHQWGFAWPLINESAALLRRQHEELQAFRESERELMDVRDKQHEAIVKLRRALDDVRPCIHTASIGHDWIKRALKETEDLK